MTRAAPGESRRRIIEALRAHPEGLDGHPGVARAAGVPLGTVATTLARLGDAVRGVPIADGSRGAKRWYLVDGSAPLLGWACVSGRVLSIEGGFARVATHGWGECVCPMGPQHWAVGQTVTLEVRLQARPVD